MNIRTDRKGMLVKLVQLVKERPILYDDNMIRGHGPYEKLELWKEIAKNLYGTVDAEKISTVKKKWKIFKDSFTKSYKIYAIKKATNVPVKEPIHLKLMEFIIPHINLRQIKGMLKDGSDDSQDSVSVEEDDNTINVNQIKQEDPLVFLDDNFDEIDDSNTRVPFPTSDHNSTVADTPNDTEAFFLSLAKTVNRLSPLKQAITKKTIANIVLDMEIREARELEQSTKRVRLN